MQGIEELSEAVAELSTVEEVMKYLEPERWQLDVEELYKPSWHVLGKSFIHNKKARGERILQSTLNSNKTIIHDLMQVLSSFTLNEDNGNTKNLITV